MPEVRKRLAELLSYLDDTRAGLVAAATGVNTAFAAVRPRSGAWSAAENLAHLAAVENGVARLVEKSVDWARSHGVGPGESEESIMSSLDAFQLAVPVTKMTAPEMVAPSGNERIEESLESLEMSRARLRSALIGGADLDLCAVTRPHRVLGEINIYQWALFVGQHEERHRKQIERTLREVTELAAECAPIV